jgi:hypothetical protein
MVEVAGRGAEEEEGSTGVPVPGSPGLGRRQSGGAMTVKAAVEERSARARSGAKRGKEGRGRSGCRGPLL